MFDARWSRTSKALNDQLRATAPENLWCIFETDNLVISCVTVSGVSLQSMLLGIRREIWKLQDDGSPEDLFIELWWRNLGLITTLLFVTEATTSFFFFPTFNFLARTVLRRVQKGSKFPVGSGYRRRYVSVSPSCATDLMSLSTQQYHSSTPRTNIKQTCTCQAITFLLLEFYISTCVPDVWLVHVEQVHLDLYWFWVPCHFWMLHLNWTNVHNDEANFRYIYISASRK